MKNRLVMLAGLALGLALFAGLYFYLESDSRREGKAEDYFEESRSLLERGELFDAERALSKAIELRPDNPEYYSGLGEVLAKEGDYARAENNYEKAAELDPQAAYSYDAGRMAVNDNRADDAAKHFEKAVAADPKHINALYQLGVNYSLHRDFDKATEAYNQILAVSPQEPEATRMLGWIATQTGDYTSAEQKYLAALELRPHYPELLNDMGILLSLQGRKDEARKRFEEALAQKPDYAEAKQNLEDLDRPGP